MEQPLIGLLDCNNFFVSCERLFRPDLVGKPVVVLSSNDGCVVARSQEIKDIGVPMGVPYFQIKDTLKKAGAVTFSSHFALYRDISRRVFAVMRSELSRVEQYSVDEAFFQVTGDPMALALRVRAAVERQVGIPVSVGIASTKTRAKQANQLAKRGGGVKVLLDAEWTLLAPTVPISAIWGVGGRLELKYKQHGLLSVADLLAADPARIGRLFGVAGLRLQRELAGEVVYPLQSRLLPQQSVMSSRSFRTTTTALPVLADAVAYHVRHAAADLRRMGLETRVLRVSIRPSWHGDFVLRGGTREVVLSAPTNDTLTLLQHANCALQQLYEPGVPYQKAGVTLAGLTPAGHGQQQLFHTGATACPALMVAIDRLNQTNGKEVVLLGSRLRAAAWQSRLEACSPAYTTRWSDVATVTT